jgi:O-antigen ligase
MLVIGLVRFRDPETGLPTRSTTALLAVIPVLAVVFAFAVGWESVWLRFQQDDPFRVRREYITAAVDMAKQRPLTGYGLGTFPKVYQRYAIKDFPFYANHAHNDWAEFAAEGGIPFLLMVLIPFAVAVPAAIRNPWGLGLKEALSSRLKIRPSRMPRPRLPHRPPAGHDISWARTPATSSRPAGRIVCSSCGIQ